MLGSYGNRMIYSRAPRYNDNIIIEWVNDDITIRHIICIYIEWVITNIVRLEDTTQSHVTCEI